MTDVVVRTVASSGGSVTYPYCVLSLLVHFPASEPVRNPLSTCTLTCAAGRTVVVVTGAATVVVERAMVVVGCDFPAVLVLPPDLARITTPRITSTKISSSAFNHCTPPSERGARPPMGRFIRLSVRPPAAPGSGPGADGPAPAAGAG